MRLIANSPKNQIAEIRNRRIIGLLTISLLLFSNLTFGQNKITGIVASEDKSTIEFSTILMFKTGDSTLFASTLSDEKGNFEFQKMELGNFYFKINYENYKAFVSKEFLFEGGEMNVGELVLIPSSKEIAEVSITSKKPVLTVTAEKTILNVANITNMTGLNGLEILRRTPGVMLDKDNNISLKGRSDVRIFMDNRPSQLANEDLVNLLKSMNASDIESVEVITNPSSKYDASGTAGIININLKKNKGFGNNVGIEMGSTYSKTGKYNGSFSFNHRDKHFNFFSNYSVNGGKWEDHMRLYRTQQGYIYDQNIIMVRDLVNHNLKLGTDYTLNSKNIIGCNFTANTSEGLWTSKSRTTISQESTEVVDEILVASNDAPLSNLNLNMNLNYRFADTLGTKFSTDADYGAFSKRQNSYQPNSYMNADETEVNQLNIYKNNTPTDIQIITLKSDYEKKIKENNFSLGYKISNVETDNTFDFFNVINDITTKDETRSNTFHYSEKVYASYFNYNRKFKKIGIQLGGRYEYTHSIGRLESELSDPVPVDRKYGNLFPSSSLTYSLNQKHVFSLTYSNRIDRPNYQDLNPFENKLNELAYQKGNAFLKPQYSHSFELGHVFMDFLTSSIGYTRTNDYMTEIVDTLNSKASYITQTNIDYVNTYNFNLSAPIPISKWWFGFLNFTLSRNDFYAQFNDGKSINMGILSYNVYMSNSFTLPKGWSMEVSGWYNSPTINTGTFLGKRMYSVDTSVKKKVLKGKGDIRLNFSDIFQSIIWSGTSNYAGSYSVASGGYESRQVRLNFSYRFGNTNVKSEIHKTGSEEEKERIKTK